MRIDYESEIGSGVWYFKNIVDRYLGNPPMHIAKTNICYAVGAAPFAYDTHRAFYRKAAIEAWCKETFLDYETTLSGPLLYGDPSFLVKLKRIKNTQ